MTRKLRNEVRRKDQEIHLGAQNPETQGSRSSLVLSRRCVSAVQGDPWLSHEWGHQGREARLCEACAGWLEPGYSQGLFQHRNRK